MKDILYFNTLEDIKLIDMMRLSKSNAHDYSKDYLTFEALEDGKLTFFVCTINSNVFSKTAFSKDGGDTWTEEVNDGQGMKITVFVHTGDKILWKGEGIATASDMDNVSRFSSTADFNVSGNIMSLLYWDDFEDKTEFPIYKSNFGMLFCNNENLINSKNLILPVLTVGSYAYGGLFYNCNNMITAPDLPATTLGNAAYYYMFNECTSLRKAPKIFATTLNQHCCYSMFRNCTSLLVTYKLPATTLAPNCYQGMFSGCTALKQIPKDMLPATTLSSNCYTYMFDGCTSLTEAPELPATSLATYCYQSMFQGCTSLTAVPVLSATTLAEGCYISMFSGCTSLTTAPELPATTLATQCYYGMFDGCTSLNYIKAMFTVMLLGATTDWVGGVAPQGTFVKNVNATWNTTGANGVPTGWTVETADL